MADAAPPATVPEPVVQPDAAEEIPVAAPPAEEPGAQTPPPEEPQGPTDELADIEAPIEPRVWKFAGDFDIVRGGETMPQHFEAEYVQKPLSYFGFLEFTGLLARKIDEAMRGPDGLTVEEIMQTAKASVPYVVDGSRVEAIIDEDEDALKGIDLFVQGLMRIASYVPDVIEECQFIWLRVPRRERAFLRSIWDRPADEGGLTNEEGEEMLSVFIDQNYEELEAFFVERLPRIGRVAAAARKRVSLKRSTGSPRSRPWSATADPTPSQ